MSIAIVGCDVKKEERLALKSEASQYAQALAATENKFQELESLEINIQSSLSSTVNEINDAKSKLNTQKSALEDYVLQHKAAVAALAATTVGIATILNEDMPDNERGIPILTGVAGAAYCLFSEDDCAEVTKEITSFGTQIAYYNSKLESLRKRKNELESSIAEAKQRKNPLLAERESINSKLSSINSAIERLTCKFCL